VKLVSPFLKHVVYPGLARTGYLRRQAGNGPAVVTYHGVLPAGYRQTDAALDGGLVSVTSLREQLRLLQSKYEVISPQQFREWFEGKQVLPAHSVLLTCDDGLQNTLSDMVPVLKEHHVSCLFFITGASGGETFSMLWYEELYLMFLSAPETFAFDLPEAGLRVVVDAPGRKRGQWWETVKQMSRYDGDTRKAMLTKVRVSLELSDTWRSKYVGDMAGRGRFGLLTSDGVRELAALGMSVGAHTLSHPILSLAPAENARAEISSSRSLLEQLIGEQVWALAYPFGDPASVTGREIRIAEQSGFECAFMNIGGGFGAEMNRFSIPRVHVTGQMSLAEFEAHVSGFYGSMRRGFARRPKETSSTDLEATSARNLS